ncbi:MAG: thiopeptide-type bacteriocin biosynthesis protein [Chryseobacterium jejuense]|uniref:thiopeptide-type bacteriocin biosynthesis protein n=1 Tax=Chryseobacterium jejuense TaxID=445960 RepID=UPI003D0A1A04
MKKIQRKFALGSEWMYVKIYTGYRTADDLLVNDIYLLTRSLIKKGLIQKFFFIRFSDPYYHIRLRLHVTDVSNIGTIISMFNKTINPKIQNKIVSKVQFDTYNREIERYHELLIEKAETVFYTDSNYIIKIIQNIIKNEAENNRWMAGILLIVSFLDCSKISTEEKLKLIEGLAKSFKSEYGFNMYNSKQFNTKYREHKEVINGVINRTYLSEGFEKIYPLIDKRFKDLNTVMEEIKTISENKGLDYLRYLGSYLHMTINRIFPVKNRLHELLLYDMTSRYYKGLIARNKFDSQ